MEKKRSRNSKRSIVNYNTINGKFKSRKKFRDPALKKKTFMKLKKNEKGRILSKRDCKLLELSQSFVCNIDVDVVVGFLVINERNDD